MIYLIILTNFNIWNNKFDISLRYKYQKSRIDFFLIGSSINQDIDESNTNQKIKDLTINQKMNHGHSKHSKKTQKKCVVCSNKAYYKVNVTHKNLNNIQTYFFLQWKI